jgi:tetratricopeptide (TPR) repeat protein
MTQSADAGPEIPSHTSGEPTPSELHAILERLNPRFQARDWDGCLSLLEEASIRFPESGLLLLERGRIFEAKGDLDQAEDCFWKSVQPPFGPSPDSFMALAQLKNLSGEPDKALWFLEEGLSQFPGNTNLLREFGIQNGLKGRWWIAASRIEEAHSKDPDNKQNILAYIALIERLEILEHYPKLLAMSRKLLNDDPGNRELMAIYIRALERNNQNRQALKYVRTLLKTNPKDPFLLEEAGRLLLNMNEFTRAVDSLRLAIENGEETARLFGLIAMAHRMNGKPLAGLEPLRKALSLDPDNKDLYALMGFIQIDLKDAEKALPSLQIADEAHSYRSLGELFLREKAPEKAIVAYSTAFEKEPDPFTGEILLKLFSERNDWFSFYETLGWMDILFPDRLPKKFLKPNVLHRWEKMSGSSFSRPEQLIMQGLSLHFSNAPRDARTHLEQAVVGDPLSEVPYWILGLIDEKLGYHDSAILWYRRILPSTREPVTLFHSIARTMLQKGESCKRLPEVLDEFLAFYPSHPGFFRVLQEWALRKNEIETALRILQEGMERHPSDTSLYRAYTDILRRSENPAVQSFR